MFSTNNLRLIIFPFLFYVHQTCASKLILSTGKGIDLSPSIDNNFISGDVPNIFTVIMMNDTPKNQVTLQNALKKVARNDPKRNSKSDKDKDDSDDDDKSDDSDIKDDNAIYNENCKNSGNCENNDNANRNDADSDDDNDSEDQKDDKNKVRKDADEQNNEYSGVVGKLRIAKSLSEDVPLNKTVSRQRNILRSIWSACSKRAAKICKKACVATSKNVCSIHKCSKKLKKAIKKSCKSTCKSKFTEKGDD